MINSNCAQFLIIRAALCSLASFPPRFIAAREANMLRPAVYCDRADTIKSAQRSDDFIVSSCAAQIFIRLLI